MTEYGAGRLRDEIEDGALSEVLHDRAGLTVQDLPSFMAEFYDPSILDLESLDEKQREQIPDDVTDTTAYQAFMKTVASQEVSEAVASDPRTKVEHVTGTPDDGSVDWSSLTANQQLRELIQYKPSFVCNIFGERDSGKTTFATSILHEWRVLHDDGVIISNYKGDWVDRHVTSWSEFRDLVLGDDTYFQSSFDEGTPPQLRRELPKLFFFDEASTWLDWRQHGDAVSKKYIPWLNRFAKYHLDALHPAHSVMSIAKELRRKRVVPIQVDKTSREEARVYSELNPENGKPREDSLILPPIENIPDSPLDVDPDLPAPWSWD
jgi:hypothetical protein